MTGFKVDANVSWSGDVYESTDLGALLDACSGDVFEESDLDQMLTAYSGDEYAGLWSTLKKGVKTVAHTTKVVAKPVAIVSGIAAAGSAVVFPPAAPVFGAVAGQAALAGTIAAKIDATIPEEKKRSPERPLPQQRTMTDAERIRAIEAARAKRDATPRAAITPTKDAARIAAEHRAMGERIRQEALARKRAMTSSSPAVRAVAQAAARQKLASEKARALQLVKATQQLTVSPRATQEQREGAQRALRGIGAAVAARRMAKAKGQKVAFIVTRKGFVFRVM